ncbi:serine hydrolase [Halostreptopolyspora alba]|uniref:serine hydrolase n=1 Tax=Halostreptopolyspora alba TaxID=2487137 RepID=UPI0026A9DED5
MERTRDWSSESEPGTSYSYSNFNYAVAAHLVAEVSGRPFSEYLALGAATVAGLALGTLGLRRASRWAARRAAWPLWWFVPHLLPQLVVPTLAVLVFLVAPTLRGNTYTPAEVVRLFPSLAVLLTALGVVGMGLTAARVTAWLRAAAPGAGAGATVRKGRYSLVRAR